MTTKPAEIKPSYTGCYSCKHYELLGPAGGWGKCHNPIENPAFNVELEYVLLGWWRYPDWYYPTGMVCGINNCPNWGDKKEGKNEN